MPLAASFFILLFILSRKVGYFQYNQILKPNQVFFD